MNKYDFEYDGRYLSDFGFMICSFNKNGLETVANNANLVLNTTAVLNGGLHELISSSYNDCLTGTIQICKNPCLSDEHSITFDEVREITRWLNRKSFHKFKILYGDFLDIYFEATFDVATIKMNNKVYGLELSMKTNRPYALHDPIIFKHEFVNKQDKYNIYNTSDDEGVIYPNVEIEILESGNLTLTNEIENRSTYIANCQYGEKITLDYPVIKSSVNSHKIQNDFNWKFFRLAKTYRNFENIIRASLKCNIRIEYNPVIKISV